MAEQLTKKEIALGITGIAVYAGLHIAGGMAVSRIINKIVWAGVKNSKFVAKTKSL